MMNSYYKGELARMGVTKDILAVDIFEPRNAEQLKAVTILDKLKTGEARIVSLLGTKGTGKSLLACMSMLDYFLQDKYATASISDKGKYTTHYEMELHYKSAMSPATRETQSDVYYYYASVPFLIVDELGRGQISDYTMSFIENVIEKRYANMLPTILVSNKTVKELATILDTPIIDRIGGANGVMFEFTGHSLR